MRALFAGVMITLVASPATAIDPNEQYIKGTYDAPGEGRRWHETTAEEALAGAAIMGTAALVADALGIDGNDRALEAKKRQVRRTQAAQDLKPGFVWNVTADEIGPPDPEKLSLARACAEDVVEHDVLDARIVSVDAVEPEGILYRVSGRATAPFGETDFQCDVKPSGRIARFALAPR